MTRRTTTIFRNSPISQVGGAPRRDWSDSRWKGAGLLSTPIGGQGSARPHIRAYRCSGRVRQPVVTAATLKQLGGGMAGKPQAGEMKGMEYVEPLQGEEPLRGEEEEVERNAVVAGGSANHAISPATAATFLSISALAITRRAGPRGDRQHIRARCRLTAPSPPLPPPHDARRCGD